MEGEALLSVPRYHMTRVQPVLSTNWNMVSPADIMALSFQPVEPATKIQGDLKFPFLRNPLPNLYQSC